MLGHFHVFRILQGSPLYNSNEENKKTRETLTALFGDRGTRNQNEQTWGKINLSLLNKPRPKGKAVRTTGMSRGGKTGRPHQCGSERSRVIGGVPRDTVQRHERYHRSSWQGHSTAQFKVVPRQFKVKTSFIRENEQSHINTLKN